MRTRADRRACLLLASAAALGILLGATAALEPSGPAIEGLPADAIALVNGSAIGRNEYVRTIALLAQDKRTDMTDADRARVLDRLIEEELLLHHGIERGILDSDRSVRRTVTAAMIASIVAESSSEKPPEQELKAFYEKNPSYFTGPSGEVPPFGDARDIVEAEYLNRARSRSLRDYIDWLRKEAKITLAAEVR